MMSPVIEEIASEVSDVKVCRLNIDENIEIAQRYGVMSIPTFLIFDKGELSAKTMGAQPKDELVALLK